MKSTHEVLHMYRILYISLDCKGASQQEKTKKTKQRPEKIEGRARTWSKWNDFRPQVYYVLTTTLDPYVLHVSIKFLQRVPTCSFRF